MRQSERTLRLLRRTFERVPEIDSQAVASVAHIARGRGDRAPPQPDNGVASCTVMVVGFHSEVVGIAVVLDRNLAIGIGEVDTGYESSVVVTELVLRSRGREAKPLDDAEQPELSLALGE